MAPGDRDPLRRDRRVQYDTRGVDLPVPYGETSGRALENGHELQLLAEMDSYPSVKDLEKQPYKKQK